MTLADLPPALPEVLAAHRLACTVESRKLLSALCECGWEKTIHNTKTTSLALHEQHRADMWREARTVRTVEQLDALPKRSVIRSSVGDYWERLSRSTWDCLSENGEGPTSPSTGIPLPALVLWTPEAATDA